MFEDGRSKKVIFIAHCILNQNSISDGTAVFPATFKDVIKILLDADIGIVQMPCPELCCLGLNRGNNDGADVPVVIENTRIRKENASRQRLAQLYCHLGCYQLYLAETVGRTSALRAAEALQRAASLCQDTPALEIEIRSNLAASCGIAGDWEREITIREELQSWIEAHGLQFREGSRSNLHNLSVAYTRLGQNEKALSTAKEAVRLADLQACPHEGVGRVYCHYASLLERTGTPVEQIIPWAEKSLALLKRDRDLAHVQGLCAQLESLYHAAGSEKAADWAAELRLRAERMLKTSSEARK